MSEHETEGEPLQGTCISAPNDVIFVPKGAPWMLEPVGNPLNTSVVLHVAELQAGLTEQPLRRRAAERFVANVAQWLVGGRVRIRTADLHELSSQCHEYAEQLEYEHEERRQQRAKARKPLPD